jgi:hypothetical protein
MGPLLIVHVAGGTIALLAGFLGLAASKGDRVHRLAGGVFVCAMLAMGLSGAGIAAATTVVGSLIGGLLASYLVLSGFAIVRPPTPRLRRATLVAASLALPLGVGCAALGVVTLAEGSWVRDDVPVPMIFLFAAVALGAAAGDLRRVRVGGPVRGRRKIAAHLWRMCFALFIASGSFFLGQADEIPAPLRIWPLLTMLALLPLLAIPFYLWKVLSGRGLRANAATADRQLMGPNASAASERPRVRAVANASATLAADT